ncbi:serine/threonine protein kinase [Roseimicrobium gellanilyticum]|uniref:Serine/threonine protein kinase n=1 Tax=Roseimicrobium gellanilyticum TaxID=748857 RepID=A0A366HL28_9BACT|nr:serine/threonine-protein kinase [Roseimicrobium gellanilyticum]RBP43649.1 serine/threonine protein kinase [Roseimicrobium gellanilyticum]
MNTTPPSGTPPEAKKCVQCGALLPAGRLEGLCAACLLQQGVMTDSPTQGGASSFEPPSIADVARLFPQLEILAFIGRGGMGAVYKARQPSLDRFVALKLLATHRTDAAFTERFGREARALAKLVHPNIVAVHDFGQVEGWNYILMEFVDGVTLRQLERSGRLSPREALQIVPQVCDALQFAHDNGVVHRDIKPENVLMDTRGRVKIADFGIAKLIQRPEGDAFLTGAQEVMGTPHYMAPEQVERPQEVDHRADIYSLGVVFYELLTGELPLGRFQPPSRKVTVDVRLDEVVLRALEKAPEMRYQTAAEFRTQVETVMVTPNIPAPADTPENAGEEGEVMLNEQLWKAVPVVAILMAFFNPWGGSGWIVFAAACAVLAVLPPIPLGASPHVAHRRRIYEAMGLRSRWAQWCCSLGWLGFIGFLGFLPTWEPFRGFLGFFGFCGLAVIIEAIARGYAKATGRPLAPPANRERVLRNFGTRMLFTIVIAVITAMLLRAYFVEPFRAATDAAAPEIPQGSHMLVWKIATRYSRGDLIAYRYNGVVCVGRIKSTSRDQFTLSHYNRPDVIISRGAVVGRVISVYWRPPMPEQSSAAASVFGPTTERVIPAPGPGVPSVLSFRTGRLESPPRSISEKFERGEPILTAENLKWLRDADGDVVMQASLDGTLRMIEAVAMRPAVNGRTFRWDDITPDEVERFVKQADWERRQYIQDGGNGFMAITAFSPDVLFFITRRGTKGVLEVFPMAPGDRSVKVRYKMVTTPSLYPNAPDHPSSH